MPFNLEKACEELLEKSPMLKKAVELREQGKLTKKEWHEAFTIFQEEKSKDEYESMVWTHYLLSRPKNLKHYLTFLFLDYFQTEEHKSIREIAEITGLTKSKVQRKLTVEADKPLRATNKDIALWEEVSVSTVRKIIKENEEKQQKKLKDF